MPSLFGILFGIFRRAPAQPNTIYSYLQTLIQTLIKTQTLILTTQSVYIAHTLCRAEKWVVYICIDGVCVAFINICQHNNAKYYRFTFPKVFSILWCITFRIFESRIIITHIIFGYSLALRHVTRLGYRSTQLYNKPVFLNMDSSTKG
jgi:hypothetical protein